MIITLFSIRDFLLQEYVRILLHEPSCTALMHLCIHTSDAVWHMRILLDSCKEKFTFLHYSPPDLSFQLSKFIVIRCTACVRYMFRLVWNCSSDWACSGWALALPCNLNLKVKLAMYHTRRKAPHASIFIYM